MLDENSAGRRALWVFLPSSSNPSVTITIYKCTEKPEMELGQSPKGGALNGPTPTTVNSNTDQSLSFTRPSFNWALGWELNFSVFGSGFQKARKALVPLNPKVIQSYSDRQASLEGSLPTSAMRAAAGILAS